MPLPIAVPALAALDFLKPVVMREEEELGNMLNSQSQTLLPPTVMLLEREVLVAVVEMEPQTEVLVQMGLSL